MAGLQKNDPLAVLFGSAARVKLLRFFLFNPQRIFSFDELARRAKLVRRTARTELGALERAAVVTRKQMFEAVPERTKKRKVLGYALSTQFPHLAALQTFLSATAPINPKTMLAYTRKIGTFDLIVASGIFVGEFDRRIDILLASKKVTASKVEQHMRALEAELGIEIKYAFLESDEFLYRLGMRDRLVRDVFDYTHQVLTDKLGVRDALSRS